MHLNFEINKHIMKKFKFDLYEFLIANGFYKAYPNQPNFILNKKLKTHSIGLKIENAKCKFSSPSGSVNLNAVVPENEEKAEKLLKIIFDLHNYKGDVSQSPI